MSSQTQDAASEQAAEQRRRKRKERAAKSRAPEPKNIVSGAGQPLDPGLRRELEEQLGHDLSRVRLHTGRDAGQLTELLGADAVAVGQDILFREGAFRPGTDEGRRLLTHELQHTVQNPHGLGALRAGRELGAVSLPQQAIEREAEQTAQQLAGPDAESAPQVEEGQATPGWLRYATVDADRQRAEAIDPATLVDRLANSLVRSLRGDPEDLSQRTRRQLAGLPAELLDSVLDRLEDRLLGPEHDRVLDLVDEIEAYDDFAEDRVERDAHDAPAAEPDTAEQVRTERENAQRAADEDRADKERPASAPGPEKERAERTAAPGSTPLNGGTREEQRQRAQDEAQARRQGADSAARARRQPSGSGARDGGASAAGTRQEPPASTAGTSAAVTQEATAPQTARSADAAPGQAQQDAQPQQQEEKQEGGQREGGKQAAETQGAATPGAEESAARNRPGAAEQSAAARPVPKVDRRGSDRSTGSPAPGRDTELPAPAGTLDAVRTQDLDGPEAASDDEGALTESTSEVEVGGAEPSAWDIELQPEDFLPEQDPDVSGVPTVQESGAAASATVSLPTPPPTKADQVQAERDAEDAEDAAAETDVEDDIDGTPAAEPVTSTAPETVGGPGDTLFSGLPPEERAPVLPGAGSVTQDPKSGDDPKAGPVTAQATVQQAARPQGAAQENAAKEEKGTAAAGERGATAQEKGSPQAAGGTATAPPAKEQQQTGSGAAGENERTGDATATSAARGSQVAGGSAADRPGSATGGTHSGVSPQLDGAAPAQPAPARAATPAPAPRPAPRPAESTSNGQAAEDAVGAAPQPERAPRTTTSAASASPAPTGGVAGRPAGRGKGKKASAPAPNLSQVSPEAGLSTAATLKPHQAYQAMGGVSGAVDRTVGDEHQQLASAPPSMQRPAGAPQTLQGKPKTDAPARYSQDPAQKSEAPQQENAQVTGAKEPEGQIEAEKAEEPSGWQTFKMALGFGIGWLAEKLGFKVDKQELAAKFAGLPTKDEALKQAQAGNAPGVQMQGAAQQTSDEQGAAVDTKGQETVDTARDDAGRSMGENQVYPDAPQEELEGKVPGADGTKGVVPGGAPTGAVPPDAASAVAEHDKGPEFQAAFSQGRQGMSTSRQTKDKDFRDSQQKNKQQVDGEIGKNTKNQTDQRTKALDEVTAHREDWRKEQDQSLKKLGDKKSDRADKVRKDVQDHEKKTDDDVARQKTDSDKQIKDKGEQAESDAKNKTDTAAQDSGNWLTKAFDWIKQKVIEIKNAIVQIIRDARNAVVNFIKNFKDTVERWINEARTFIVDTIKTLIDDLIEFAVEMVREIIELAQRIRKLVTDLIEAAIALVTRLAAELKQLVTDLLNQLAKMLSDILNILKKMLMDVIKSIIDAVKTILDYASKLLGALGEFMMIAIDFLDDPGGWLSGAKNSAVDGAKHYMFREVQTAVKQWFQEKIQEIIGVPKAIIEKLIKGGFSLAQIVKETWDAVVPQLPFIIGEIVITKVVAKLIPGAGWAMAVIDAIRTAIGALGAILSAMGAVLSWLRAVRQGGAGLLFAKAVAAGIVALLELAYQYLLSAIGKYVAKVGRKLRGIAAKLFRGGGEGGGPRRRPAGGAEDEGAPRGDRPARTSPSQRTPSERTPAGSTPADRPTTRPKDTPTSSNRPKGDTETPARPRTEEPSTTRPKEGPAKRPSDRPDTRPTPTVKPKPKPEPEPKPKTPADRTPDRPKDSAPDRPKDETPRRPKDAEETPGTNRPKDGEPGRPKEGEPGRPERPKETEDPKKPRTSKDDDPKKPKHGEDDPKKPKRKPEEDGPGRRRPKHEKEGPGRPKHKRDKDRRKKKEDSKESKDERLEKIIARIRPMITRKVANRMFIPPFRAMLGGLRLWYRLTSLTYRGEPEVTLNATLNPTKDFMKARRDKDEVFLDALRNDDLPDPLWPNFADIPMSGATGRNIKAQFLSARVKKTGQDANLANPGNNPPGWKYITDRNMQDQAAWVRMHLIPEGIGGMASGNNLVPARRETNNEFKDNIELEARDSMPAPNELMWYRVKVALHSRSSGTPPKVDGYPESFPSMIEASYGGYTWDSSKPRRERSSWTPKSASKTYRPPAEIRLPDKGEAKKLQFNTAGERKINAAMGGDKLPIARVLAGKTPNGASFETVGNDRVQLPRKGFGSVDAVQEYLEEKKGELSPEMKAKIPDAVRKLREKEADPDTGIDWYPY
ncbi:eCIS core domain-containing protein [Streptomyces sp. NPDC001492]